MKNGIEGLMLKNGFTPKDIQKIKKFSKKSGNSMQVEVINLGNGLLRLVLVFYFLFLLYVLLFILILITIMLV